MRVSRVMLNTTCWKWRVVQKINGQMLHNAHEKKLLGHHKEEPKAKVHHLDEPAAVQK